MVSFRRAFIAGVVIGVVEAVVAFNWIDQAGLIDFLDLRRDAHRGVLPEPPGRRGDAAFSFTPKRRPVPERLRSIWWVRNLDRGALLAMTAVAIVLPLIITQPSRHLLYTSVLVFALCGLSLTILTGWAGQLSLGQMAFAGIGALLAASFDRGITVDIGWHSTRIIKGGIEGLGFGPSILVATFVTAGLAALIGVGALRVRGLLLAVSTFAFGLAASQYFYNRPILSAGQVESVPFLRTSFFGLGVGSQRTWYYVTLVALVIGVMITARLRRTGVGRTTIGVRDNEEGASGYTVEPKWVKLRTFALAGGIAGLGGALLAGSLQSVPLEQLLRRLGLALARRDRGDRRSRLDRGPDPRLAVGDRPARVLPEQPTRAPAHVERRPARHAHVLPGGLGPGRVLGPRRAPARRRATHGPDARHREEDARPFDQPAGARARARGEPRSR